MTDNFTCLLLRSDSFEPCGGNQKREGKMKKAKTTKNKEKKENLLLKLGQEPLGTVHILLQHLGFFLHV